MPIPRIPARMDKTDPVQRPCTRAMHPILAMKKPSIIKATPARILKTVFISNSDVGMAEGQYSQKVILQIG